MTTYRQGETVLVRFPFTDLSGTKKRPALVISANWYNRAEPDCILAAITSTVNSPLARDEVLIRGAEVVPSGLISESVVRAGKVFTIQQDLIYRSLGRVPHAVLQKVFGKVQEVLSD